MDAHTRQIRIANALWGLFIGDALAMPVHWFYNPKNISDEFNGGIAGYESARHPHPESFMVGMGYHPDVKSATRLDRPYDILHEHVRFYNTSYHRLGIDRSERESEHGNATPALEERYHYHHGLNAGENTLGAHLVRVLLRSVVAEQRYDQGAFLRAFIAHLATPGRNRDPYTEIYIRRWFENYSVGLPPHACAELQRNSWSIGSHGGLIRPMVVSLLAGSGYQGLGLGMEHQNLTHRSENNASALGVLVPLLHELIGGRPIADSVPAHAGKVHLPEVRGRDLFARYRDSRGPGNIPPDEMWRLHTRWEDSALDVASLAVNGSVEQIAHDRLATACYPEHGLPLALYLAARHHYDLEAALLANANAGGDNVHRGMMLGLVMGAGAEEISDHLKTGLIAHDALAEEIDTFSTMAVTTSAF